MKNDTIPAQGATAKVDTVALAASLLFRHGQTTEKTAVAAEQLGRTPGVPVKVLSHWDELVVELDHTSYAAIVPATPPVVHMGKVLAVQTIVQQASDGAMPIAAVRFALEAVERMPPVAILRFAIFAAIGAASLGVIFGVGFSAIVSMMPGFFLFHAARTMLGLVASGPRAPADLVTAFVVNGATAFLIILAMTVGLVLPRVLFERFAAASRTRD